MSKKLIKIVAAGVLLAGSYAAFAGGYDAPAQPVDNAAVPYVELHGGVSFLGGTDSNFFNTGFNLGGAVGASFNNNFRAELEFTYFNNHAKDIYTYYGTISSTAHTYATMVNGYYDIDTGGVITPFVGAGIGWVHLTATSSFAGVTGSASSNEFGYQGIVGLNYHINQAWTFGVYYKILGFTSSGGDYYNSINGALTYHFAS